MMIREEPGEGTDADSFKRVFHFEVDNLFGTNSAKLPHDTLSITMFVSDD